MSTCRYCREEIEFLRLPNGAYKPVDPEPVFVVEGEGSECFFDEELGEIVGRRATPEETKTLEDRMKLTCAFVPHRKTCGRGRK